jgi:antitoxin CptB
MTESAGRERRRLLWRCRRGMKELDVLLERYLKSGQVPVSAADGAAFERLLELPDPELADYLLGHKLPGDPSLAGLVRRISHGPAAGGEDG